MFIDISFKEDMSPALVTEFEKKIYYISEDIVSFTRVGENGKYSGMKIEVLDSNKQQKEIEEKAYQVLESEVYGLKDVKPIRIWDNDDVNSADSVAVLKDLLDKEIVHVPGSGQVAYREPLVSLFYLFDSILKGFSIKVFGGIEYIYPTLLSNGVLKKVGYFDSFPNLLMFSVRLKNEISNYTDFKEQFKDLTETDEITDHLMPYCTGTKYGLPPTMCYYVYDMLSGKEVKNRCVTARGKSFRFENKYCKPFERLWDFTIRETVFLGDSTFVRNHVNAYKSAAIKLMEKIGMHGFCESANDPFFLVEDTTNRINVQKMFGSKYELRMRINKEDTIAIGSFNIHGQFLSKRFKLYSTEPDQEFIYTGCIGIGLERFIFSFLSQFGTDMDKWPEFVKNALKDKSVIDEFLKEVSEEIDV